VIKQAQGKFSLDIKINQGYLYVKLHFQRFRGEEKVYL